MRQMARMCVLLIGVWPLPAAADDSNVGPTYTDPAAAGHLFDIQGEYRGWQRSLPTNRSSEPIGLQVIARGEGRFDAVKYYGGLPGQGWRGDRRYPLSGELVDGVAPFFGDSYDLLIDENGVVTVFDKDGREAGGLVKVQRASPTLGAPPPPGAIALFQDESDLSHWRGAETTADGLLRAGTETSEAYQDFRLHLEFRLPLKPSASGQARGNSGVYLQSRYEVQILDSFGLEGLANECGALYRTKAPDVNMCLPPLQWQTYDIDFRAPRFDGGEKIADARISVWHNGILIHNHVAIPDKTGNGRPEGPQPLPTRLQDHGNPVVFRNIWVIPGGSADERPEMVPSAQPPLPLARLR